MKLESAYVTAPTLAFILQLVRPFNVNNGKCKTSHKIVAKSEKRQDTDNDDLPVFVSKRTTNRMKRDTFILIRLVLVEFPMMGYRLSATRFLLALKMLRLDSKNGRILVEKALGLPNGPNLDDPSAKIFFRLKHDDFIAAHRQFLTLFFLVAVVEIFVYALKRAYSRHACLVQIRFRIICSSWIRLAFYHVIAQTIEFILVRHLVRLQQLE